MTVSTSVIATPLFSPKLFELKLSKHKQNPGNINRTPKKGKNIPPPPNTQKQREGEGERKRERGVGGLERERD